MEAVIDAFMVSVIVVILIVVGICAVVFAVMKKKRDYDTAGIPEMVDDPKEKEGSTDPDDAQE